MDRILGPLNDLVDLFSKEKEALHSRSFKHTELNKQIMINEASSPHLPLELQTGWLKDC